MPHNPRKRDIRALDRPLPIVLTNDQIAEAMERALALRLRSAVDPEVVETQAMDVWDAMDLTRGYRTHSWWYRMNHEGPDPWWWIGWVHETPGGEWWRKRTWEVWLNVDDGRVHLRFDRPWRGDEDECPYP